MVGFFSVTNIIFSLFFVLYFKLNVTGVALGTLVSSTLTSFIFLIYTFSELKFQEIGSKKEIYNKKENQRENKFSQVFEKQKPAGNTVSKILQKQNQRRASSPGFCNQKL